MKWGILNLKGILRLNNIKRILDYQLKKLLVSEMYLNLSNQKCLFISNLEWIDINWHIKTFISRFLWCSIVKFINWRQRDLEFWLILWFDESWYALKEGTISWCTFWWWEKWECSMLFLLTTKTINVNYIYIYILNSIHL